MKKICIVLTLLFLMVTTMHCQSKDKIFTTLVRFNQGIQFGDGSVQLIAAGGTGSMTYPSAGIAVSTGSSWGTSVVNNSANWNTAYSWGNHAGLYRPITYVPTFASITGKPTTLSGYGITDAALATHNHNTLYKSISWFPTWAEVTGKPVFAVVATTGSYVDLVNKPEEIQLELAIPELPGISIPVLTSAEIAVLVPQKGLILYNDTDGVLQIYNGTVWKVLMTNQ